MEIKVIEMDDTYTHLALIGRLDVIGAGEVENKFIGFVAARKKNAVIDLSGVSFLGSMGIRLLITTAKALGLEGKQMILLNPRPLVLEVLGASGIDTLIEVTDDAEAAVLKAKS
jgi:anti-anti-sigma factor